MTRACVIGWPIGHSRSPIIHNYWLSLYRIAGTYTKLAIPPDELKAFLLTIQSSEFVGCNVTLPHKEAAFSVVKPADDDTRRIRAVNTVYIRDGTTYGTNTDSYGFLQNLREHAPKTKLKNHKAVILGAGGSALAVATSLLDQGVSEIAIVNRTLEKAERMCRQLGTRLCPVNWSDRNLALADCALLVNTTSLGMTSQPPLEIDLARLPEDSTVADIVYSPLITPLLHQARARALMTVPGLGMLLYQAVPGFALWFGTTPTVTPELYDLVARDLDPTYVRC
ncbi:MAG: shikimate dehydrogenase [Alphaproteobacteria bacterium]|nr:shikimate dehydrogenase [Alphaproteobacteria bacterium]